MLRVDNITKTYPNGTQALKGVSFQIPPGEFVVVLGKSGSGKSTLLRCINRLIEPTSGRIFLDDSEITGCNSTQLRGHRRKIGMIFQHYNLVKRLSVFTNVLSGRLGYTSSLAGLVNYFSHEDAARAYKNLERMEIAGKTHDRADSLSGGQQQRVGIARALMQEPTLMLADEPVSSLDPATSRNILLYLRTINEKDGVTVVCNLHVPELAVDYADRVLALKNGELVFDGPPSEFDGQTRNKVYNSE